MSVDARGAAIWPAVAGVGLVLLVALAVAFSHLRGPREARGFAPRRLSAQQYERWARAEFFRRHPGERPLNWRLAQTAVTLHRLQPMGKFVLAVKPGEWGNDCSDFVDCIVDEALGARARCFRGARDHVLGAGPRYVAYSYWDGQSPVQAGDLVSVRHSPWYDPDPDAAWHVGILGPDGMVYDFAKLRRWSRPRYGRHSFAWFVRYSLKPNEVLIGRLRPQYRYRIEPIPVPASPDSSS